MSALTDKLKSQAPTAAVSAIVALIAVLAVGGTTDVPNAPALPDLPTVPADPNKPAAEPRKGRDGLITRLVSCGDSTQAMVVGDDRAGVIAIGAGAGGACTLLFAAPWDGTVTCAVNGGTIASATSTDLVMTGIVGASISYRCNGG